MNRRQFLGASLAGIIAALCLPFERFAEWCGAPPRSSRRPDLERVYVTVWDFGAKGDGRADDTEAIQAAINFAAERGGIVRFPAGYYRVSRIIRIPGTARDLVLDGDCSQVLCSGTYVPLQAEAGAEGITIRNFWFRGQVPVT